MGRSLQGAADAPWAARPSGLLLNWLPLARAVAVASVAPGGSAASTTFPLLECDPRPVSSRRSTTVYIGHAIKYLLTCASFVCFRWQGGGQCCPHAGCIARLDLVAIAPTARLAVDCLDALEAANWVRLNLSALLGS